jgi:hypothetical protein
MPEETDTLQKGLTFTLLEIFNRSEDKLI